MKYLVVVEYCDGHNTQRCFLEHEDAAAYARKHMTDENVMTYHIICIVV